MIRRTLIAILATAAATFSAAWAQPVHTPQTHKTHHKKMYKKKKKAMHAAFLIQRKLPHYSKILNKMWSDPKLALTAEQKSRLETIRKETVRQIRSIASKVRDLTREIVKASRKGVKAETLYAKVDTLALLKAKATKVQLQCIEKTTAVLTPEQLQYLNQMIYGHK